jgi:sulfatase modifying factor 1
MRTLSIVAIGLAVGCAAWFVWGQEPPAPRDPHVEKLIGQLGADEYKVREAAQQELDGMGDRPLALLREAVRDTEDPEIRWRALRLLTVARRESKAIGLALTLIKEGEFRQGSAATEQGRWPDETQHDVRITRPFYLGVYEVTQAEYRQVMKVSPSSFSPTGNHKAKVDKFETQNFPVENISFFDALAFCNELSKLDHFQAYYQLDEIERSGESIRAAKVTVRGGHGYRLPTEAEWEYACRAGTATPYHYGAGGNGNSSNVRGATIAAGGYGGEIKGPNLARTCVRGNYPANAWGLFDMHGNVGEWCFDFYDKEYYAAAPRLDPAGPAEGKHRVWRGGSWLVAESSCRSAARSFHTPDERKDYLGFRVARNP